jgi:hypothetical protein
MVEAWAELRSAVLELGRTIRETAPAWVRRLFGW